MSRICQDQITRYIKKAIDESGSYLIEDILYSLRSIIPKEMQDSIKTSKIKEKLNAYKEYKEKKKNKKLLDYVA
jgi:hypothetical protein